MEYISPFNLWDKGQPLEVIGVLVKGRIRDIGHLFGMDTTFYSRDYLFPIVLDFRFPLTIILL